MNWYKVEHKPLVNKSLGWMIQLSMISFILSKEAITIAMSLAKLFSMVSSLANCELTGIWSGLVSAVTSKAGVEEQGGLSGDVTDIKDPLKILRA